jgi:hypothetical protein
MASAQHHRLEVTSGEFDHVTAGRMSFDGREEAVHPTGWNEWIPTSDDEQAVWRKPAEILRGVAAIERVRIVRDGIALLGCTPSNRKLLFRRDASA